ncbi:hypothetical protein KA013_04345 [Patescibacteria group bacterium]|nr:hypothetical protein [Patescibacteria group bacterium]
MLELIEANNQLSEMHRKNIITKISETQLELLEKIPIENERVQIVFTASIDY